MKQRTDIKSSNIKVYDLNYLCSDGDGVSLNIYFEDITEVDYIQINCFSGIGCSYITVDEIDFGVFNNLRTGEDMTTEEWGIAIANFLCKQLGLEEYEFKTI